MKALLSAAIGGLLTWAGFAYGMLGPIQLSFRYSRHSAFGDQLRCRAIASTHLFERVIDRAVDVDAGPGRIR